MFKQQRYLIFFSAILMLASLACGIDLGDNEPDATAVAAVTGTVSSIATANSDIATQNSFVTQTLVAEQTAAAQPTATETATPEPPTPTATPEPPTPTPTPEPAVAPGLRLYTNANYINGLLLHDGLLWAATSGGLVSWNLASDEYVKLTTEDGLVSNEVIALTYCELGAPYLIAGTAAGINMLNLDTFDLETWTTDNTEMADNHVTALVCFQEVNVLFIGYDLDGVDAYDADDESWANFNRRDGILDSDFVDEMILIENAAGQPELWVASFGGITVLGEESIVLNEENGMPDDNVSALADGGDGVVWVGAFDGLIRATSGGDFTLYNDENVDNFPFGSIRGIGVNGDGTLWIGSTFGEVCLFDPASFTCLESFESEPGMARDLDMLFSDEAGNVYFGDRFGTGISVFDGLAWRQLLVAEQMVTNRVLDINQSVDGTVWIATNKGVYLVDPTDDDVPWTFLTRDDGLPSTGIAALHPDPDGGMWLGGIGLAYTDGSRWRVWDEDDGLVDDFIRDIELDDQGRVWIATSGGISIWDGTGFTNFGEAELPEDSIRDLQVQGEIMWAATGGGGILRFAGDELTIVDRDNSGLTSNFVDALAITPGGELLVGAGSNLLVLHADGAVDRIPAVDTFNISRIFMSENAAYIATLDAGVYVLSGNDVDQLTLANAGLPADYITAVFIDSTGSIWFGGGSSGREAGGLVRFVPEP